MYSDTPTNGTFDLAPPLQSPKGDGWGKLRSLLKRPALVKCLKALNAGDVLIIWRIETTYTTFIISLWVSILLLITFIVYHWLRKDVRPCSRRLLSRHS